MHNKNIIYIYMNTIFYHICYFIILYLLSYLFSTEINLARIIIPIISLYMLFSKREKYTSTFIRIKALLVLIPIIIFPYYNLFYKNQTSIFFTIILMLNILEVSVLLGFNSNEKFTIINGIYLLILSLLTPLLNNFNNNNIKFDNNFIWAISKTIILSSTYLFNNNYFKSKWRYSGIYSVLIPTIHMIFTKKTTLWLPLRAYSLVSTFLIDSTFPSIHNKMVTNLNKVFLPSTSKYNILKYFSSVIELILIILLIKQGYKKTILDYFYKFFKN